MMFDENALIHDREAFARETLISRRDALSFSNLARMELFLWNLEIFLQIQSLLPDKIVLKGGAAAQFYIPMENQSTSVDIDMICTAGATEVEHALRNIESRFNGQGRFFKFRPHRPKRPKTELPLLTYYMDIPSICETEEIFGGQARCSGDQDRILRARDPYHA
jgi:hypothetical protein